MSLRAAVEIGRKRRNYYNKSRSRSSAGCNSMRRSQSNCGRNCKLAKSYGAPISDPHVHESLHKIAQRSAAMAARRRLDEKFRVLGALSSSAAGRDVLKDSKNRNASSSASRRPSLSNMFTMMLLGLTRCINVKNSSRCSCYVVKKNMISKFENNFKSTKNDHPMVTRKDTNNGNTFNSSTDRVQGSLSFHQKKHSHDYRACGHERHGVINLERSNLMSKECSVCLDGFQSGQMMVCLPCDHIFHKGCIVPWLHAGHYHCPFCRAKITPITMKT